MAMNGEQAKTILARQRRARVPAYLLMAFGAVVVLWAWFDKDPPQEEVWRFLTGMLALFYGESLLTTRNAKIQEAEELLGELEVGEVSMTDAVR